MVLLRREEQGGSTTHSTDRPLDVKNVAFQLRGSGSQASSESHAQGEPVHLSLCKQTAPQKEDGERGGDVQAQMNRRRMLQLKTNCNEIHQVKSVS